VCARAQRYKRSRTLRFAPILDFLPYKNDKNKKHRLMASSFSIPSFRLTQLAQDAYELPLQTFANTHDAHPSIGHLCLLVFEAVLEVVCVSLPGYIVARLGHFDAEKQKFLANLNVMLFTPCLSKSSKHR
jgi:hypothetical protein